MQIRKALPSDRGAVLAVERLAFGYDKEANLVDELLDDPTAQPALSLLAFDGDRPVGHVLFTAARLIPATHKLSIALLAPLAVVPDAQRQGVGGRLIADGLELLTTAGVDLVFVLGHPDYYPRHGFQPAFPHGLAAPYPIPPQHHDAWMVQALRPNLLGHTAGQIVCADALNRPEHWRE